MSRQRGLNIPAGLGNTFAGNHALQECLAEYKKPIKAFQGKRKKLAVLSKPHILLSQMVLLSEHLMLNLDWMKF